MKMKFLFINLLMLLLAHLARADFTSIAAADVVNVDISSKQDRACIAYQSGKLYTLTLTTTQKTYAKSFCENDYFIWGQLYTDVYDLVKGADTPQCTLSEFCDHRSCRRVYGRTLVDSYDILLKTNVDGALERHSVRLRTHCGQ